MNGFEPVRLTIPASQLVIVDIQERMLPHIAGREAVLAQSVRMIQAAVELGLPITISEQYVRGLGPTVPPVLAAAGPAAQRLEKLAFSVLGHAPLRARIAGLHRPQVLLVGIETHVCVQQTALDLLRADWTSDDPPPEAETRRGAPAPHRAVPVVLADAVGSRRPEDRAIALERMRAAGAVVTTVEAAIFELLGQAGTDLFRRLLPLLRELGSG